MMPTLLKAALLGIVQGLLEFLPVSSTAHLIIASRVIGFADPGGVFIMMIQLGSILAVMWLYREKIVSVLSGLPSDPGARQFALKVVVGTIPALVAGALFATYIKSVLYASFTVIGFAFLIGGVVMLVAERLRPIPDVHGMDDIPLGRALAIGCWQTLALIPGVSRSGGTIVGAMLARIDRPSAAEFSFFLAMPVMAAAFAHDLLENRHLFGREQALEIAVGFIMAFLASAVVVKPFVSYVRRSGFSPFAWYRILVGLALLGAVAAGVS